MKAAGLVPAALPEAPGSTWIEVWAADAGGARRLMGKRSVSSEQAVALCCDMPVAIGGPVGPARQGLTANRARVLLALRELRDRGISPSYVELKRDAGIASSGIVWRAVRALERLGLITVGDGPRSIELTERGRKVKIPAPSRRRKGQQWASPAPPEKENVMASKGKGKSGKGGKRC